MASETPAFTMVIARPSRSAGTSCAVTASDIAQNPERAMPSSSRDASISPNAGAMATSTFDAIASVVRPVITHRRSTRGSAETISGPPMMPLMLVAVTSWPAAPSVMPSSAAIGESRLAGRNSLVTSVKMPSPSAATASQAARGLPVGGAAARRETRGGRRGRQRVR